MKKIIKCIRCYRDKVECGRGLCSGCYARLSREGGLEEIPANRKHSINQDTVKGGTGVCKNCEEVEVRLKRGRWICRNGVREQRNKSQRTGEHHKSYLEGRNTPRGAVSEWVDSQYLKQLGLCGICQESRDKEDLQVDHDHSAPCQHAVERYCADCVRGLLCRGCNLGLGFFEDNVVSIGHSITYLKRHSKKGD